MKLGVPRNICPLIISTLYYLIYQVKSRPAAIDHCKCYPWTFLNEGKFMPGDRRCTSSLFLICCTLLPDHTPKTNLGDFCCFDQDNLAPPSFIKRCDPRLKEFIDFKSFTPHKNFSRIAHNASFLPVSNSLERSLIPNAIMVFFSLFFVFVYCFASLRRDLFRNRIYIERRVDCCRLGHQLQMHNPRASRPPQPPDYNSIPKDPPRYSSIFGASTSSSPSPPIPTASATTSHAAPPAPSNERVSETPSTIMNTPSLITSHAEAPNDGISLYTAPLQVLFLSQNLQASKKNCRKQSRFTEAVRNILASNQQRRIDNQCSEVVIETTITPSLNSPSNHAQQSRNNLQSLNESNLPSLPHHSHIPKSPPIPSAHQPLNPHSNPSSNSPNNPFTFPPTTTTLTATTSASSSPSPPRIPGFLTEFKARFMQSTSQSSNVPPNPSSDPNLPPDNNSPTVHIPTLLESQPSEQNNSSDISSDSTHSPRPAIPIPSQQTSQRTL